MIASTLTPAEIALVRAAATMTRTVYAGGSVVAVDGRKVLFSSGGADSFEPLWREAEEIRAAEVAA